MSKSFPNNIHDYYSDWYFENYICLISPLELLKTHFGSIKLTLQFEFNNLSFFSFVGRFGCLTLARQHPMKSLSSTRLSVNWFVHPSVTKFSQDWIINFF